MCVGVGRKDVEIMVKDETRNAGVGNNEKINILY